MRIVTADENEAAGPAVVDEYGHDEDHFDNDEFEVEDADGTPSMPVHPIAVDPDVCPAIGPHVHPDASPEVVASMPVEAVVVVPEVGVPSMPVEAVEVGVLHVVMPSMPVGVDHEVAVQIVTPSMPADAARVDINAAPGMGVSKPVRWDNVDIVSKQASQ